MLSTLPCVLRALTSDSPFWFFVGCELCVNPPPPVEWEGVRADGRRTERIAMFGLTVGHRTGRTAAKSGDVQSPMCLLQGAESLGANSVGVLTAPIRAVLHIGGSLHSASEPWVCLPVQLQNLR